MNDVISFFNNPEVVQTVVTVGLIMTILAILMLVIAVTRSEGAKAWESRLNIAFDMATSFVMLVEAGDIDLEPYELRADEREEAGLSFIDPRMLYVMSQVDKAARSKGFVINTEEIYSIAENAYNNLLISNRIKSEGVE